MINLFSDTQTRPSQAMRDVMARAAVGDEQLAEDPTVIELQDLAASMLGKEAALFLPSGTMCNLIGVRTHTHPGDMILADRRCHVMRAESGGAAMFNGVMIDPLEGNRGIFTAEQVATAIPASRSVYHPHPTLLCIEQTHNYGGGAVWSMDQLRAVADVARKHSLMVHMDGARLFNASIASGVDPREYGRLVDSVWIDLSKGLGCPVGAVLAGSKEFIGRALRYKHAFGGAMRQAGIIAAAGIYALRNNIERLKVDHENARLLADGLGTIKRVKVLFAVDTNIVFFQVDGLSGAGFARLAKENGVRFSVVGAGVRAVTHLDVTRQQVEQAVQIVRQVL